MRYRLLLGLVACIFGMSRLAAANVLTVNEVNLARGGQELLEVKCNFETTYTAFELELVLPKGLSLMMLDDGKPHVQRGFNGNHVVSGSQLAVGVYKFICYSMSNSALPMSGLLMKVMVQADAQSPTGQMKGSVRNIEVTRQSDYEGEQLASVNVSFNISQGIVTNEHCYLRNVVTGKFWGASDNWGTQASLVDEYQYATLNKQDDGSYTLESMVSNGGTSYYFGEDGYMDKNTPAALTIEPAAQGYFTVSVNGGYCGWDGSSSVLSTSLAANDPNALWQIMTEADVQAEQNVILNNATVQNPVDVTFLIKDAGFGRNRRDAAEVWNSEAAHIVIGGPDENARNYCSESYHSAFRISQTINNVPKGVYKLTAQGFYRQDGSNNMDLPCFFINDEQCQFHMLEGPENSMTAAGEAFLNGLYKSDPMFVRLSEEGVLTVGAELKSNTELWSIWDNFQLTYYGPDATIEEAENADSQQSDDSWQQWATNALEGMKQLTEETNFYTDAARHDYYDQWAEKFEQGKLTKAEAYSLRNPYEVTGWRISNIADDLLMSVWDEVPEAWDSYHVNTWSVEGETDGSNFRVPYIEYWTEYEKMLAAKTMTATLENLQPNETYEVKAWVRVRMTDGISALPKGATIQIGNGNAIDVAAGERIGNSQYYIKEYSIKGKTDAEGRLIVKFVVSADNNINWIAFKNLKYMREDQTVSAAGTFVMSQPFDVYTVTGILVNTQVTTLDGLPKGIYIVNGRKVAVK